MRLIDADDLQLIPDQHGAMNEVLILDGSGGKTMSLVQTALKRMIDNATTVDAVPVVHGLWVVCGDGDNVPWLCSHCGKTTAHKYKTMYGKYCPNCGAKMDGGKENG